MSCAPLSHDFLSLHRRLRLADHEREAIDVEDDVVAARLLAAGLEDHLASRRRAGSCAGRRSRSAGSASDCGSPTNWTALVAAQPAHHPLVRRDQAVVVTDEEHGAQLRQDLVDALGLLGDDRVQPLERLDDVGLDQDLGLVAREARPASTNSQPRSAASGGRRQRPGSSMPR